MTTEHGIALLRRIEDRVASHGINRRRDYVRHVIDAVEAACMGRVSGSTEYEMFMDWGRYLLYTDEDTLRRDLQDKREGK